MGAVAPEALAISAAREYLLASLPAKVAALNLLRPAVLKSALIGPFTVPSGAVLKLSASSQEATPTGVTLTSGTRTAAQVAADITAASVPGLTAGVDAAGRLTLTSSSTPAAGAPSVVVVARDSDADGANATGSNAAFGWAEGGEHFEVPAIVAPSWRGVIDGKPLGGAVDMGQGFWVMLGRRTVTPTHPGIRRDTFNVSVLVELWRPFSANAPPHRSREPISACVRAVREVVESDDGRYLGRQWANDIQLTTIGTVTIDDGVFVANDLPGVLFDIARLTLNVRVFQRPD